MSAPASKTTSQPPPPPNPNAAGVGAPVDVSKTRVGPDGAREVPRRFERCEVEDLIALIASMCSRLVSHNDQIPLTASSLTRFHSRSPPSISVSDYLLRIARYTNVEHCCLLILLHYIDRVCDALPGFTISSLTVHRFIIASVSAGSKALSDLFCTNARYARVGGITLTEMNLLEREFCIVIDYRLTTTRALLDKYYTQLVVAHPGYRLDPTSEAVPDVIEVMTSSIEPLAEYVPIKFEGVLVQTKEDEQQEGEEMDQGSCDAAVQLRLPETDVDL